MSEAAFSRKVLQVLALHGRKVLRVSDRTDGRHGQYGLRAIGTDIASTGADYLVLPRCGMKTVVCRDVSQIRFLAPGDAGFFLELKDPFAVERVQPEQERWLEWVNGAKQ